MACEPADQSAPFQIIHVGAAAPSIPQPLIDQVSTPHLTMGHLTVQLARPGRMFIPVGQQSQGEWISCIFMSRTFIYSDIWQIDKAADGSVTKEKLFGVMVRAE